jgi:hypothetical protein
MLGEITAMVDQDEPYLGRESVFHFDQMIVSAMEKSRLVGQWTFSNTLSPIQKAATEIIPHGFALALAIRELIRTGYLFPAEVLTRPLLERAAVISYLADTPDAVTLWVQGWPYKTRPSLATMLTHMRGTSDQASKQTARDIVDQFNALIHADPLGSYRNVGEDSEGRLGFMSGPNRHTPDTCDHICFQCAMYLVILVARMTQIFPIVLDSPTPDDKSSFH